MAGIFISYRRDGGEAVAQLLNDRLKTLGFQVFYDIESLHSGAFDKALYGHIDACDYFVLILSPRALDRCVDEEDWVRKEILYAHEQGKRIIPLFTRGFAFPSLPSELEWLPYQNGVQLDSMMYLDSAIEKLISFFDEESSPREKEQVRNLDEKVNRWFSEDEKEGSKTESALVTRMSKRLLERYFNKFLSEDDVHGDYFFVPIVDGELSLYADESIDVQALAVYVCAFDRETKKWKTKVTAYEPERRKAQTGFRFSIQEHLVCHNEYTQYGDTMRFYFSAPTDNGAKSCEKTEQKVDFSHVTIDTETGFGETRIFLILINHTEHQMVQILPGKYSKFREGGIKKEYIAIDMKEKMDLPYSVPKEKNNALIARRENNVITYAADMDNAALLYDPVSREIIRRYISEGGAPEVKLGIGRPTIAIPILATTTLNGEYVNERMMTAYELGKCYFDGTCGFPHNVFKAMEFFEEDGNADALYEAGYFLYRSEEFSDKELAFEHLLKAALCGNQKALPPVTRMLKDKIGRIDDLDQYEKLCELSRATIEGGIGIIKKMLIKQTATLFNMLAEVYYYKKEYSNAIKYDGLAVSLFDQMPPLSPGVWDDRNIQRARYTYCLGVDYCELEQYELAEEHLQTALQLVRQEYYWGLEWNCITVGILHCRIMRWLVMVYRKTFQYKKKFQLSQVLVARMRKLKETKAEGVFQGEYIDVAENLIADNAHRFEKWLLGDLIDLGWAAYDMWKEDMAVDCAKEVINAAEGRDEYRMILSDAYHMLAYIYKKSGQISDSEIYTQKAEELRSTEA